VPPAASVNPASTSQLPTAIEKKPVAILKMAVEALVNYLRIEKPLDDGATRTMIVEALNDMVDQYEDTNFTHVYFNV
jgi:hypothetical protein